MNIFSLSRKNKALPDSVFENGSAFPVNTDFRIILRILRLLHDPEVLDMDKHIIFLRLFFRDAVPKDPYAAFSGFVSMGQESGGGDHDFDYEQDAPEIYSAFMQVYGIDLLECAPMHWWKFSALLSGCFTGSTALSNKVQLRHLDDSPAKRKNDMQRAKRRVEIGANISRSDAALEDQIRKRLENGESIADLIGGESIGRRQTDI